MATYTIQDSTLEDIGDAIRLKTGGSSKMTPQQMATAISNLNPSGGGNVPAGGTTGQVLTKHSDTDFDTEWANGGSGGSTVSVTQVLSSGTKIATVTVDGAGTDIFAPAGGGGGNTSLIAADFSASASYNPGDLVVYDGGLYRCNTAHSGAWSASDFTAVTVAGELKASGWGNAELASFYHGHALQKTAPTWQSNGTYSAGDFVLFSGDMYRNLTGVTGSNPSADTTNWIYCAPIREASVFSNLSSGTQIAAIRVNNTVTRLYAPAGGSIEVVRLA